IWLLVEEGALSFHDRIADHVPEFARNGKGDITLLQVLTHQGGFPGAAMPMPPAAWEDHALLRKTVCDFTLEWTPGSIVQYHPAAAHWVAAVLIEAIAKIDYREFIRTRVIEPLGLGNELYVGLPDAQSARAAELHQPAEGGAQSKMKDENTDAFRRAGVPGGGGYGTARAASARRSAGPIPRPACRSPISPTAGCRTRGTRAGSTSSAMRCTPRSRTRSLGLFARQLGPGSLFESACQNITYIRERFANR